MFSDSPIILIGIILTAGLIFLAVGEYLFLDMTGIGKRKAIKEFLAIATSLGFKVKEKRSAQNFGTLKGRHGGYHFIIKPDDAKVIIEIPDIKGLKEISTWKGEINFSSENKEFDKIFRTRLIAKSLIDTIKSGHKFQEAAIAFVQKWHRQTEIITIEGYQIICIVKYGFTSYIPASVLKEIVPELTELADAIQQDLGNKKTSRQRS
ncbi:hypothetical protein KAI87_00905 [Myxococcota bacterium]|nr:hypothetical protein [Myxococcota bacterium]